MTELEMLEKILTISKDNAVANTKLVADMTQIVQRVDEQRIELAKLSENMQQLKVIIANVNGLKIAVATLSTKITVLEKINTSSRLDSLESFKVRVGERLEKIEHLHLADVVQEVESIKKKVTELEIKPIKKLSESVKKIAWIIISAGLGGLITYFIKG